MQWGPVSISSSHHLILYTNLLYGVACLYFTLSPNTNLPFKSLGPVSISISHHLILYTNLIYALIVCVIFTTRYMLCLIHKLWGPVSISSFSPPNSIYKPGLCFNCVCHFYHPLYALILIYKLWGPVSISISHHLILYTNMLYALIVFMFKLWGPVYISLFSPHNSIYKPTL